MGITAQTPPLTERKRKYEWSEADAKAAWKLLEKGDPNQLPGDSGYDTFGKARSAAQALLVEMAKIGDASNIGVKVWGREATKDADGNVTEPGDCTFALTVGKRDRSPKQNGDEPSGD